jgi:hypothetical protein
MIAGHDQDRYPAVRNLPERLEGLVSNRRDRARPVEHVARVNHEIHLARERGFEREGIVGQKVVTATTAFDPRTDRKVEPEMRVSDQKDPDFARHGGRLYVQPVRRQARAWDRRGDGEMGSQQPARQIGLRQRGL